MFVISVGNNLKGYMGTLQDKEQIIFNLPLDRVTD